MSAVGHPPNASMLPNLVNRYAICTVPALDLQNKNGIFLSSYFMAFFPFNTFYSILKEMSIFLLGRFFVKKSLKILYKLKKICYIIKN